MDSPPGSRDYEDPREKREMIKINQRAILQFFNIRVIVNPERIEIKGTIPTQILDKINKEGNRNHRSHQEKLPEEVQHQQNALGY